MMTTIRVILLSVSLLIAFSPFSSSHANIKYKGVNLASAEFQGKKLPGKYNIDYAYPTKSEIDYFTEKGMNTFRLAFKWERLQHKQYNNFNFQELSRIRNFVEYSSSKNAYTILDVHNYARYYGEVIGTEAVPTAAFAEFWTKLALEFKNNPLVIFGLMNEPYEIKTEQWLIAANAAIAAIRKTGAKNLILVPGNHYSGAHSWYKNRGGSSNAEVMLDIEDPENNYAYEVHQYVDQNSSGTSTSCVSETIGTERLTAFTQWLREHKKRGFLGEFGVSKADNCLKTLDNMIDFIHQSDDVWLGWTYWAAGPRWGDYIFSIEPGVNGDKPQMNIIEKYLTPNKP